MGRQILKINASTLNLVLCMGRLSTSTITGFTGCVGERSNRTTGESIDDQSALNDNPEYRFSDIHVDMVKCVSKTGRTKSTGSQKVILFSRPK